MSDEMRQIRQQNSGRCPMTDAGWAERKVVTATTGYHWNARRRKSTVILPTLAAKLLLAEHRRAVRVVKAEYDRSWKKEYVNEAYREGRLNAIADILAALQKGRT